VALLLPLLKAKLLPSNFRHNAVLAAAGNLPPAAFSFSQPRTHPAGLSASATPALNTKPPGTMPAFGLSTNWLIS
jgi:hypothetical protein